METNKTYLVTLSEHLDKMGDNRKDRIKWLEYHAKVSKPTAEDWLDGRPSGVNLAILRRVVDALETTLENILVKGEVSV